MQPNALKPTSLPFSRKVAGIFLIVAVAYILSNAFNFYASGSLLDERVATQNARSLVDALQHAQLAVADGRSAECQYLLTSDNACRNELQQAAARISAARRQLTSLSSIPRDQVSRIATITQQLQQQQVELTADITSSPSIGVTPSRALFTGTARAKQEDALRASLSSAERDALKDLDLTRAKFWHTFQSVRNMSFAIAGSFLVVLCFSYLYSTRDANARDKTEKHIRLLEQQFQHMFDHTPEGICHTSVDGRMLRANAAMVQMFGYESKNDLLATLTDVANQFYINPEDRDKALSTLLNGADVVLNDCAFRRKDGSIVYVHRRLRAVRDVATGSILYIESTMHDISERINAQAEKERFLADLQRVVDERTADLNVANEYLNVEITKHRQTEVELEGKNRDLVAEQLRAQELTHQLVELNTMLVQSSQRFEELYQALPIAAFCYDAAGQITDCNRAYMAMCGPSGMQSVRSESHVLLKASHVADTNAAEPFELALESFCDGIESQVLNPDGSVRHVMVNTFPKKTADGKFVGGICTIADVTSLKSAQFALHQSEERIRAIAMGAPIILFAADRDGAVTVYHGDGINQIGVASEEIIGRNIFDLAAEEWPKVHQYMRRAYAGERFSAVLELNGHHFESWYNPEIDEVGNVIGVIGVWVNISDRIRIEEALDNARLELESRVLTRTAELEQTNEQLEVTNAQLEMTNESLQNTIERRREIEAELVRMSVQTEQVLAAISSILIGVDENGRIQLWNSVAANVFGLKLADVDTRLLIECPLSWDAERIEQAILACTGTGRPVSLDDMAYIRTDGARGILGVTLSPISPVDGAGGCLLLAADITQRRAMESQLSHAQKLESIGQLAAGIAHEINTPIQYISDNTRFVQDACLQLSELLREHDALVQRALSNDEFREQAQVIIRQAETIDTQYLQAEVPLALEQSLEGLQRVSHIVRAMKDFSHPGGEGKTLEDINRAIESAVTVARNEWKYIADLVTEFDLDLPRVPCYPAEINQVILNLTINAAHAIADARSEHNSGKGLITIRTRQLDAHAEIELSDNGCGIPDAIRARIFDPFFTTKEVGRGTGQGLAIARAVIVEKHSGTIEVESEAGRGTTFTIRLPLEVSHSLREHTAEPLPLAA